jgi:hypothetical protein
VAACTHGSAARSCGRPALCCKCPGGQRVGVLLALSARLVLLQVWYELTPPPGAFKVYVVRCTSFEASGAGVRPYATLLGHLMEPRTGYPASAAWHSFVPHVSSTRKSFDRVVGSRWELLLTG